MGGVLNVAGSLYMSVLFLGMMDLFMVTNVIFVRRCARLAAGCKWAGKCACCAQSMGVGRVGVGVRCGLARGFR